MGFENLGEHVLACGPYPGEKSPSDCRFDILRCPPAAGKGYVLFSRFARKRTVSTSVRPLGDDTVFESHRLRQLALTVRVASTKTEENYKLGESSGHQA